MRSIASAPLLVSLAVTATLTSAFAPSIADACGGGYGGGPRLPSVFAVDDHVVTQKGSNLRRAFVLFGRGEASDKLSWTRLWPSSYDYTRIADAPDSPQPTTVTLIGSSGAHVVSSNDRTFVADSFRSRHELLAMEVGIGQEAQFPVAVLGSHPDAKWLSLVGVAATTQATAWVKSQGVTAEYVSVVEIKGTKLRVISARQPNSSGVTSFVLDGTTNLGTFNAGNPIGAIALGPQLYVLLEEQGLIRPVAV